MGVRILSDKAEKKKHSIYTPEIQGPSLSLSLHGAPMGGPYVFPAFKIHMVSQVTCCNAI